METLTQHTNLTEKDKSNFIHRQSLNENLSDHREANAGERLISFSGQGEEEGKFRESRANEDSQFRGLDELQGSSWNNHNDRNAASPVRAKKVKPKASPVPSPQVFKKPDRMPLLPEELPPSPVRAPALSSKEQKAGRGGAVKLPKPRAKDPNKREMSMEEKQKLGIGLQSLPQEKMPQLVQIIRKRNEHLAQDGDEIELDIEALDTETLWELDRFVTNWKKMGSMSDKNDDSGKKSKENDDEEVDIDDDMPATSFPPVEIEKDDGMGGGVGGVHDLDPVDHGNASSSSSSSGSSSSDSSSSSWRSSVAEIGHDNPHCAPVNGDCRSLIIYITCGLGSERQAALVYAANEREKQAHGGDRVASQDFSGFQRQKESKKGT
ncbi:Transcription factor GTE2 [Sesamum angolense]|uniref:Transcription factor GTE2 n=1 Tax=Sesamum angolense TaxID=2727404 RepID=A0AAE1T477_9LAMI|nr:Transcription factor GTE2 [Sesamum angolense]